MPDSQGPLMNELDSFGRSTGHVLKRDCSSMQTVSYGYDDVLFLTLYYLKRRTAFPPFPSTGKLELFCGANTGI